MPDSKATRHIDPAILARTRELRRPMTPAETKLWQRLHRKQLYGLKFRRQEPVFRFIVDFLCHEHKLVVEVDGQHRNRPEQQAYGQARTAWLAQQGCRVIRFTNHEVQTNIGPRCVQEISRQCGVEAED